MPGIATYKMNHYKMNKGMCAFREKNAVNWCLHTSNINGNFNGMRVCQSTITTNSEQELG